MITVQLILTVAKSLERLHQEEEERIAHRIAALYRQHCARPISRLLTFVEHLDATKDSVVYSRAQSMWCRWPQR